MAKLKSSGIPGFNAGQTFMAKSVRLEDIALDPDISQIFGRQDKVFEDIKASMKKFDFDKSQPLVVWKLEGKKILLDGHTRLAAAKETGLKEVPVVEMEFESRDEAILYTFRRQKERRNLTNKEIMTAAKMLPNCRSANGEGRAAKRLGDAIGVSASTIYKAQRLQKEAPDDLLQLVDEGEMSIKGGWKELKRRQKPAEEKPSDEEPAIPAERLFLRTSVTVLIEAGQRASAELLINHFLKKNEKHEFYELLEEAIRVQLSLVARTTN